MGWVVGRSVAAKLLLQVAAVPMTANVRESVVEGTAGTTCPSAHMGQAHSSVGVGGLLGRSPVMDLGSQTSMAGRWPGVSKGACGGLLSPSAKSEGPFWEG